MLDAPELPTLNDFFDRLKKHDWYYGFSDDMHVYDVGARDRREILDICKQSDPHFELFKRFSDYHFSGSGFGTEQKPRPSKESLVNEHTTKQ